MADKILHALNLDFEVDGQHYNSSASIGVALLPEAGVERRLTLGHDPANALENGELAMHMQLQVDSAGRDVNTRKDSKY